MASPFDDGPSLPIAPPLARPEPSIVPPPEPPEPTTGPQLLEFLQQNIAVPTLLAGSRHWYPEGQLSLVLHGAFAPGGVAPPEKHPAKVARDRQQRTFDTVME